MLVFIIIIFIITIIITIKIIILTYEIIIVIIITIIIIIIIITLEIKRLVGFRTGGGIHDEYAHRFSESDSVREAVFKSVYLLFII